MFLTAGTKLGPYEIISLIGAGGMGEVYRAKDTRLDRVVAVKILPSHLSSNPDLRQRFEREARTISSLSHPNICALYDIGHHDGTDYLVMEYLEGETLADRLLKGPLSSDLLFRFGVEIVSALEKAHKQGIVHRDLKPGNIMLTKGGAKLLDFGLAKFQTSAPQEVASKVSAIATEMNKNLTAEGSIVGTFQYMAPEQLEGKEIDSRTDIFALGTVLYEMATGKKAFSGTSQAGLIASILSSHPLPISTVQPLAPPALDRVVKTCLAKDPEDRWQTAHDIMLELKWVLEGGSQAGVAAPVAARRKMRESLAWSLASAFLVVAVVLSGLYFWKKPVTTESMRLSVLTPPETTLIHSVISPDGKKVALILKDVTGKQLLWIRSLESQNAHSLPETDGAVLPFWSPDSRHIGFFADGKLKRIEIGGGQLRELCESTDAGGGSWNRQDVIIFSGRSQSGYLIYRVSASGGPATPLYTPGPGEEFRWPYFLPDGRHFLFLRDTYRSKEHHLRLGSLDSMKPATLIDSFITNFVFSPPGYLLFSRQGVLVAQRFDPEKLAVIGDPLPLIEQVALTSFGNHHFSFSVSENDILAFERLDPNSVLTWYDRSGQPVGKVGEPGRFGHIELSPDGKSVAVERLDADGRNGDVWVIELARNIPSRITLDPNWDSSAVWSPDGEKIAFGSDREGTGEFSDVYIKNLSTGTGEQAVFKSPSQKYPMSWSPDGKYILVDSDARFSTGDILLFRTFDNQSNPFMKTPFNETDGQVSPDGRCIAYVSNETGKPEIYVQSFPTPGGKIQVSTNSGFEPRWRRDGKELFYLGTDSKIWAVEMKADPVLQPGFPKPLFQVRVRSFANRHDYDVTADGQRFLVNTVAESGEAAAVHLVFNWRNLLRK